MTTPPLPTVDEIREHTSDATNRRIDHETLGALAESIRSPVRIRSRLVELDREWNVDRALMLNFAVIGGFAALMAMRTLRRTGRLGGWGVMFFTQLAFLANHAVRRWCPPLPVFRRLGFRSDREIAEERAILEKKLAELDAEAAPAP